MRVILSEACKISQVNSRCLDSKDIGHVTVPSGY
jgi:hypothetical protein